MLNKGRSMNWLWAGLSGATMSLGGLGCAGGINPNQTLGDLLAEVTQTVQGSPALNQLTVGDLVAGFQDFAGRVGGLGAGELTDDQILQFEDLQSRLDDDLISEDEFAAAVEGAIPDLAAGHGGCGRGNFGGPLGFGPGQRLANLLDLTDDQITQARDIYGRLRDDIEALRQAAHDDILALLTAEQQAILDDLFDREDKADESNALGRGRPGGPDRPGRPGFIRPGRMRWAQFFIEVLDLTQEQQDQIRAIREALRDDVAARHQQARDEFRAILTPEQLNILDALESAFGRNHDDEANDDSTDDDDSNDDSQE